MTHGRRSSWITWAVLVLVWAAVAEGAAYAGLKILGLPNVLRQAGTHGKAAVGRLGKAEHGEPA